MKKSSFYTLILSCLACFTACKENIDTSVRYVFSIDTIMSYLEKHPESYSTYTDLLKRLPVSKMSDTTVGQLLTARGHYTVFAPTNEAIDKYLCTLVEEKLISEPKWEAFTDSAKLDSVRQVIVKNSIIDSGDEGYYFETTEFPTKTGDEFSMANMNDRKYTIRYVVDSPDSIYLNDYCPINIRNRDIRAINGVIHQMEKVIAPKNTTAADYLQDIMDKQEECFLVMARAIQACGLMDTLKAIRDEVYEMKYQRGEIENLEGMNNRGFAEDGTAYAPEHRKYGFTIFAETDDFWRSQGLDPKGANLLQELTQWIKDQHQYSDDDKFVMNTDYASEDNLLYQWVTYHILPMKLASNKIVYHENESGYHENPGELTIPVYDIYTTMGKRRLLKAYESKESNGIYLNRFPVLDNGRRGSGHEVSCDPAKVGCLIGTSDERAVLTDIVNACIYPIDAPLSYNDEVRDDLHRQRLRIDVTSFFPESMNNDIRKKHATEKRYMHVYLPKRSIYPYFADLWNGDQCNYVYYNAYQLTYTNLNVDEHKAVGRYDITYRLPPFPRRGTYEIRYGYIANGNRGVAQIYFGSDLDNLPVTDIPLDMTLEVTSDPMTGFERDTEDEDYNAEVDKRMRNNGFMKGGLAYTSDGSAGTAGRYATVHCSQRRILTRQTMDPDKTYYLRMQSVLDSDKKEFIADYIEYCPKEVYDNPSEPEDIW